MVPETNADVDSVDDVASRELVLRLSKKAASERLLKMTSSSRPLNSLRNVPRAGAVRLLAARRLFLAVCAVVCICVASRHGEGSRKAYCLYSQSVLPCQYLLQEVK